MSHRAWVEVDLAALVHNAGVLRRAIPASTRLGLMVKANGYGHGLEMAARAAVSGGADQLMVASLDEGLALRGAGISAPLLVVYSVLPDAVDDAVHAGLELSVSGMESAGRMLDAWRRVAGRRAGDALRVHVEVDTGMGRGGVPADTLADVVERVDATPATTLAGFWSHLTDGSDAVRSREQAARFEAALARLDGRSGPAPVRHIAATEALFCETAPAYDMVRIGIGYYGEVGLGVAPAPRLAALAAELRPAMSVKARPMRLEWMPAGASVGYGREWTTERPSLIATLPIGYADGWSRRYWPGAMALLRGRRVPLVGRVSMDSICVDVTDAGDDVTIDEEFVLLGAQGTERIPVTELAALRGSIPNEVFCSFGARLHRDYLDVDGIVARSDQEEHLERVGSGRPG